MVRFGVIINNWKSWVEWITTAHIEQLLPSPTTYQRKIKTQTRRRTKKDAKLPQTSVPQDLKADEVVYKEGAITTTANIDAAQDSDNIIGTQTTAMPNVDIPQRMYIGGSPRRQDTIGGAPAQTRSERVLEQPIEPPVSEGGYTPGSDEGRLKLQELMTMCTKLSKQVLDLEKEKDAQAVEILRLKKRVKRLERQRKSSTSQPRRRKYRQLEAEEESTMAFELIKFIKSMLEE
ncbi:hypothetical protein Tco_1349325 [Tanacetum coccineum]